MNHGTLKKIGLVLQDKRKDYSMILVYLICNLGSDIHSPHIAIIKCRSKVATNFLEYFLIMAVTFLLQICLWAYYARVRTLRTAHRNSLFAFSDVAISVCSLSHHTIRIKLKDLTKRIILSISSYAF